MKVSRSEIQLETVVSRIRDGEWDLQPNFQRGEVWDQKRRQRLVDTILRGWYVPAVHIVVESDGTELVLDGQQRLVAIRDFFNDGIKVDGLIEPHNSKIAELHGLKFSQLPDAIRREARRFMITVVALTEFDAAEPNELFFRLNQSYNLTPSEKRNALHGTARNQVRALVDRLTLDGLLAKERIGFSNGRLAYDDIVARACVVVESNTARRHVNNNVVEAFYRNSEFDTRTLDSVLTGGQVLLAQIQGTKQGRAKFNKGTLQTWLLYCYWAESIAPIPNTLLADFESARTSLRAGESFEHALGPGIAAVLRLYDDRASYRVTDVSSVLIRDLAIHLFACSVLNSPPHLGSDQLLESISSSPDSAATMVSTFLEASSWGDPLLIDGEQ